MAQYLNPTIVSLDELNFTKLDVAPGTALMIAANFGIQEAGVIDGLAITVDRDNYVFDQTCSSATINTYADDTEAGNGNGKPTFLGLQSQGGNMPSLIEDEDHFHPNLKGQASSEQMIKGAIFTLMVRRIFLVGTAATGVLTQSVDFSDEAVRKNNVFFYNSAVDGEGNEGSPGDSPTATVTNTDLIIDIQNKTKDAFVADSSGSWTDVMAYWAARTTVDASGLETETVPFANDDKVLVMYELACKFIKNNVGGVAGESLETNNNAINTSGTEDSTTVFSTNFNLAETPIKFILQWRLAGL